MDLTLTLTPTPAERLRILRTRARLELADAAPQLGCTAGTLSRVELGARAPSGRLAAAIERVWGIPASDWWPAAPDSAQMKAK